MSIGNISSKIISTLGSPSSIIPLMVKDAVDSASITYYSYKAGGKIEGRDRAIDEFGTQAIWIGGIPFFKKIIDKTAYKLAKVSPNVDPRIFKDNDYAEWAKTNAKGFMGKTDGLVGKVKNFLGIKNVAESVQQAVEGVTENAAENAIKIKKLYGAKVIAATVLTLISYFSLNKLKQKTTKKEVEAKVKTEHSFGKLQENNQAFLNNSAKTNVAFSAVFSNAKKPSFKGLGANIADGILFNPVHNMKLIDAGITTERLAQSRNKTEFFEHAIKEGVFWFFMYGLSNLLQKGINKASQGIFKKPVDLDIKLLMDDEFKSALASGKVAEDAFKMPDEKAPLKEFLEFLTSNPDSAVVKAAKKSGIIETVNGSDAINTAKFIDRKEVNTLADNLKNISDYFNNSKESIEKYLKKTKGLKVGSVILSLGACCFVLGYVVPELVYRFRKKETGSKDFHVEKDIEKNLEKNAKA